MNFWGILIFKMGVVGIILEVVEFRENSVLKVKEFKCVEKEGV